MKKSDKPAADKADTTADATAEVQVTLNGLLDEALGTLNPLQQWAVGRNFRRQPANRRQVIQSVELHIARTNPALMPIMDAEGFGADTQFTTTVAGKGELLKVILDNLPAILDAIIKILGLFGAILLAFTLLTSSANAAGPSRCANGSCSRVNTVELQHVPVARSIVAAGSVATRLISAPIAVVAPVINQARPVAAIANTRQQFSYKPSRAFLGGIRPIKRVASWRYSRCH